MSLTMTVQGADRRLHFNWEAAAGAWANGSRSLAVSALKIAAPRSKGIDPRKPKPGTLRDSISSRVESSGPVVSVITYSTVPYARFVVGGTRAHTITAKNAPRLAWPDASGTWHYALSVNHPGTRPNKFPERALAPLRPALADMFAKAVREATL